MAYLTKVRKLEQCFFGFDVKHVSRKDNFLADELAHLASSREPVPVRIFEQRLTRPSIAVLGDGEWDAPLENRAPEATPPFVSSTTSDHNVAALLNSGMIWMD